MCVVSTDRISCGRVFLPQGFTCVHGGLSVAIPTQPHHTQLGARRELATRANWNYIPPKPRGAGGGLPETLARGRSPQMEHETRRPPPTNSRTFSGDHFCTHSVYIYISIWVVLCRFECAFHLYAKPFRLHTLTPSPIYLPYIPLAQLYYFFAEFLWTARAALVHSFAPRTARLCGRVRSRVRISCRVKNCAKPSAKKSTIQISRDGAVYYMVSCAGWWVGGVCDNIIVHLCAAAGCCSRGLLGC